MLPDVVCGVTVVQVVCVLPLCVTIVVEVRIVVVDVSVTITWLNSAVARSVKVDRVCAARARKLRHFIIIHSLAEMSVLFLEGM